MSIEGLRTGAKVAAVTAAAGGLAGFAMSSWVGAAPVSRMLPWVLGRGLGIAAYLSLTALTGLGLWLRHPAAQRWRWPAPDTKMRLHAVLGALTGLLVLGHVVALVLDSFAGVGVLGAVVPGASGFRRSPSRSGRSASTSRCSSAAQRLLPADSRVAPGGRSTASRWSCSGWPGRTDCWPVATLLGCG